MSAGFAALAGAVFLGKRKKVEHNPASVTYIILGTGLLWFGWFGFNAGSALGANADAVAAFANTNIASAVAMLTWIFFERFQGRKMSALGASIGAIVGLVAITPAAGFVNIGQSMFIGFAAAIVSNYAIRLKNKTVVDDTLDVFPSHGVGGIVGMLLTAVFAKEVGLIYGETQTFIYHVLTLFGVAIFTFGGSWILYWIVDKIIPIRVREDQEERGLDLSQHGEEFG
jgi:Amt family ammonium transporter